MRVYEELLVGAIDLHCHVDLEFSARAFRKREPEWEWLPRAEALGMRGVVLKSHWWPTAAVVPYIQRLYRGPVDVWSSITLNPVAGGPELWAVETAAALGARVVFLPTWGARQDLEGKGFHVRLAETFETFRPEGLAGITFVDEQGRLTEPGRALVRYCHRHDLTLATGHVSWRESLAFAEEARAVGFERLIFSHPLSRSVRAPLAAARRAAELGAWVELCGTNVAPGRLSPAEAVAWIRAVGVERVVLSSDYFRPEHPSPPELLRLLLGTLYDAGLTATELRMAVATNPARALGVTGSS
jgi:uncharacterized protein DUF6282